MHGVSPCGVAQVMQGAGGAGTLVERAQPQIYNSVVGQGRSSEQAGCYADGIIDAFTFDQLMGDHAGTEAGMRLIEAARDRCL